jgi:FtsP/CotA-like multicopper oxidase with cupredoxin domain
MSEHSGQSVELGGKKVTMTRKARWVLLVVALATALAVPLQTAAGTAGLSPFAALLPPGSPPTGMVCDPGSVSGTTHTFNLIAKDGYIDTPDGNSLLIWSYANADAPANGHFQYPGPVLCVTQGQTVVVNLTNNLTEASSIVFPGQDAAVTASGGSAGLLTTEAAANSGTVSYSFTASQPGTYLYESGSDVAKQVEMGLYGALVVRPSAGADLAYNADTQFDPTREYLLLLTDLDPDLHFAVQTGGDYDINALHSRYFTINGRMFPDTIQDNGTGLLPNQPYGSLVRIQPNTPDNPLPALVRMVNVGLLNHPFHPHGNHTTRIAQDGRLVAPTEHFGETLGSGQTEDYLLPWVDVDHWAPGSNPLASPNYRNVFFKDGNTWYSGSPYLGTKGTLPVGTTSQNICGEWYFPWHSHALNEFANFDAGFGGMATLLRVDPPGGCTGYPTAATIVNGALKTGAVTALGLDDTTYYQVKPKTTTRPTSTNLTQTTITVQSAAGFPKTGQYYVRIDNEIMRVTGGQGTTTWTVVRHDLGTAQATHAAGATVNGMQTDWYTTFKGLPAGASNLAVTYKGRNCSGTTGTTCASLVTQVPSQTVKICDWTVGGANGCATATSAGWTTLPPPPAQPQSISSSETSSTWTVPNPPAAYVGTGAHAGEVRVLVSTTRSTNPSPAFTTWANLMKIVYDAP